MRNAVMLRKFNYPAQNSSQWSHSSFRWRIILGLCEKSGVEKRDLTTGKLNIKPSARGAVFTSDLYVNTRTHIEYISNKISWGKSQPWQKTITSQRYHYDHFYFPVQSSKMLYEKLISLALHSIGTTRQTVRHQGVPKSTSSIHSGSRTAEVLSDLTRPARAFHK